MTLYVDNHCEIAQFLLPWITEKFYDFGTVPVVPGATYIIGREQLRLNADRVRSMVNQCQVVFSNPAEGSETMIWHLQQYGIEDLVLSGRIKLIVGGRMPAHYPHLLFEHFLTQPLRFEENQQAQQRTPEIFSKLHKPYSFLCLNGRSRPHRETVLNELSQRGLLDSALWTNLDNHLRPIQLLPEHYEVTRYRGEFAKTNRFVKSQLFKNEWGEIYLQPEPYIDTYFSLVTETVFDYPYSFFTEKIAKPLTMGHPFVAVASQGFYRDLHNLGFKTFGHLIDESFDSIESNDLRIQRIIQVVEDLSRGNLQDFLLCAEPICKYNQQHLQQFSADQIAALPHRVLAYINE